MAVEPIGPRIGRLERDQATIKEQVRTVTHDVRALRPVPVTLARMEGEIRGIGEDVTEMKNAVHERADNERALRIALVGLSGTILVTLVGAIVTLLLAGHP